MFEESEFGKKISCNSKESQEMVVGFFCFLLVVISKLIFARNQPLFSGASGGRTDIQCNLFVWHVELRLLNKCVYGFLSGISFLHKMKQGGCIATRIL